MAQRPKNWRVYFSFKLLIIIFYQAQVVGNLAKVEQKIKF